MDVARDCFTPARAVMDVLRRALPGTTVAPADAACAGARRVLSSVGDRLPARFENCESSDHINPVDVLLRFPPPL